MSDFADNIKEKLNTKILGRELIYLDEVGSTQEYIKSNLTNGLKERISCDN